jgi:hypothetical protein
MRRVLAIVGLALGLAAGSIGTAAQNDGGY